MKSVKFDIKYRPEIESGKYKLMCNGLPVEVLKWDRQARDGHCIVGLVKSDDELIYAWDKFGRFGNTDYDLKLYTEDLNEFELSIKEAMLAWNNPIEFRIDDDFVADQAKKPYSIAFNEGVSHVVRFLKRAVKDTKDDDYDSLLSLRSNIIGYITKNDTKP